MTVRQLQRPRGLRLKANIQGDLVIPRVVTKAQCIRITDVCHLIAAMCDLPPADDTLERHR